MNARSGWSRIIRVAAALALALTLLPIPMLSSGTAEAWSTGAGYRQDENSLRTVGVSSPAKGVFDFASGSGSSTENIALTTSYYAGTVADGTAAGGTSEVFASRISIAYMLLRDTKSGRWVSLQAHRGSANTGTAAAEIAWTNYHMSASSLWGTGLKDAAAASNPRSSVAVSCSTTTSLACAVTAVGTATNLLTAATGILTDATDTRRSNGIISSSTGERRGFTVASESLDAAGGLGAIGSCDCEGNSNGRAAFLTTAQITSIGGSTAASDTLTVNWSVAFATPQVAGPVEIWSAAETANAGYAASLYDGWDRYTTKTIGTAPYVGITSIPSGATVGSQASYMIEATDPEAALDAADIDMRSVALTIQDAASKDWVELIYYHRKSDSTKINTDDDEKFQVQRSDGRYSGLSDGSAIEHAWLTYDQPDKTSSGDNLRVTFRVTFKEAARGKTFNIYARVLDREFNDSGLRGVGTTRVQ